MAVDRDKILQAAQKLVDKKRYDKALVEYRKLVADDPGDVRTLLKIGDLYLKLEQHEKAIQTYEQVGEYYYREGFSVKAIAVYKQIRGIIRRHAQHLEGRYGHIVPRLAEIYTQLGLTSDALAAYDEVATRLRREGRERDALDIFRKVVDLDPQNPIAHLRVADSRGRLGELDKAVERFGEAARIMVRLGRKDDAIKVLERLLEFRQDPDYAKQVGELYLERGAPNDGMAALSKLQIAFKANPKDLDTLGALAAAFDAIDQPKKAVEVLKESARIARDSNGEAFARLVEVLVERAPNDPMVAQLHSSLTSRDTGEVQVEVLSESEIELDESIDEVFELDDADIQPVTSTGADGDLFGAADDGEPSAVRRLVSEAERQRTAGHVQQAIGLLQDGLRNLGATPRLRQKLSDLLLEAGDTVGCITEKLILAQELAGGGQVEPALEMLDEVLLLQPGQPDAVQMRANLGFPPGPGEPLQNFNDLQLNAPMMSYDVESGGVEEVLTRSRKHSAPLMPAVTLDDPFAGAESAPGPAPQHAPPLATRVAPMTPHTLDEEALDRAEVMAELGRFDEARQLLHSQLQALPNHPLVLERLADIDALAAQVAHSSQSGPYPISPPGRPSYASHPPNADSAAYGQPQPGQPGGSQAGYPPAGYPQAGYPQAGQQPGYPQPGHSATGYPQAGQQQPGYPQPGHSAAGYAQAGQQQPGYPQPGQSAAGYPQAAYPEPGQPAGAYPPPAANAGSYPVASEQAPQQQVGEELAPVLEQVRAGVRNQVAEGDSATHYDLGVAYLEMGLHDDALSELTLAARDPLRECVCLSMIGTIHLQLGDLDTALDALHRALNTQQKTPEQELALGYEIANTYELKLLAGHALRYFEWLAKIDPNYADPRGSVAERIERLRTESGAQPRPQAPAPVPDGGEIDEALDDLFGGSS